MKKTTLLLIIATTFSVFSQKRITNSQAINLISKQAMLSQRMAKNKIYYIQKARIPSINSELNSSAILFEKNIKTLSKAKLPAAINKKINKLDLLWVGYKANIKKNTPRNNTKTNIYSDIILDECNNIYKDLTNNSKKTKSYPYNSSDQQFIDAIIKNNDLKYLSQQLAFYYAAYYFKQYKYNHSTFSKIVSTIDNRIEASLQVKTYSTEIAEKTDEIEFTWKKIRDSLRAILDNKFISTHTSPSPEIIYKQCNQLLKDTDQLSRAYKANNDLKNN